MEKRHVFPVVLVLALFGGVLGAQSNQVVDRLLDEKAAQFGDAAYMILNAAGIVPEEATDADVVAAVQAGGWLKGPVTESQPITLGQVCYLIMKTQKMSGGLLYRMFPGPRYATREFAYMKFIRGIPHPGRTVSGEEVMRMLESAIEKTGGQS